MWVEHTIHGKEKFKSGHMSVKSAKEGEKSLHVAKPQDEDVLLGLCVWA